MPTYGLHWPGKAEAAALADVTPEYSLDLLEQHGDGTSSHTLAMGDNLPVLQHWQHSHAGHFRMIYIDPPYNTGNPNFVYTDRFGGEVTEGATLNLQRSAQRHTEWLSMIYPRLILARRLLRDDGAIFISIDDAELYHLRILMDEVFGEENFVANMIRRNKTGSGHDSSHIAVEYDYVLVYAKRANLLKLHPEIVDTESDPKYRHSDNHVAERGRYYLRDLDYKGTYSESGDYPITAPDGTQLYPGGKHGKPNTWRWSPQKVAWGMEHDYIVFKQRPKGWKVYIKQYQYVDNKAQPRQRTLPHRGLMTYLNAAGSKEVRELMGGTYFSFPKSTELLMHLIGMVCDPDDAVLDFFAGSGTTAHAVMRLNAERDMALQSYSVQQPEPFPANAAARRAGYEHIAELTLSRILKAKEQLDLQESVAVYRLTEA